MDWSLPSAWKCFREFCRLNRNASEIERSGRRGNEHEAERNISVAIWSLIPSRLEHGPCVQKPVPSTFHGSGSEEHEDDSGSNLLRAKKCKICLNVGKLF